MLQRLHEKMQGWIFVAIVGLICLSFALWGLQNYLQKRSGGSEVAVVNGVKISAEELRAAVRRYQQNLLIERNEKLSLDQETLKKLRGEVLKRLIQRQVLDKSLAKEDFFVSDDQVDMVLAALPIFQINGKFSLSRFQQVLSRLLYSEREFFEELRRRLMANQLQISLASSSFVLPDETARIISLLKQKRDIGYFVVPSKKFLSKVTVTNQELQNYYQQHQADFTLPEKVSINYLRLSPKDAGQVKQVTQAQLHQFYTENIDLYTVPQRWQVERILLDIAPNANVATFDEMQKKLADLAKQAKSGKDFMSLAPESTTLHWYVRGQMSSDFYQELMRLKSGQVSQPFRTPEGFNIVRLKAQQKEQIRPFAEVATQVRKAFIQQQKAKWFSNASEKLADLTYTSSDSLEPAAKELGLEMRRTGEFGRNGEAKGLLAERKVLQAAFSDTVLQQQYNSDPIELDDGSVVVLRINKHQPEIVRPFAKVKPTIADIVKTAHAEQQAQQLAEKLLAQIAQGAKPSAVAEQNNLAWHTIKNAERQQQGAIAPIVAAAFNLSQLNAKKMAVGGKKLADGDYAVVQVTKVIPGKANTASAKQRQFVERELHNAYAAADHNLYIAEQILSAKVKISNEEGYAIPS